MSESKYHPVGDTRNTRESFEAPSSEPLLPYQHNEHTNYAQRNRTPAMIWIVHSIFLLCNLVIAVVFFEIYFNNRAGTDTEDMEYGMLE